MKNMIQVIKQCQNNGYTYEECANFLKIKTNRDVWYVEYSDTGFYDLYHESRFGNKPIHKQGNKKYTLFELFRCINNHNNYLNRYKKKFIMNKVLAH